MLMYGLPVLVYVLACTAVCCAALYYSAVNLIHEVAYQRRLQVMGVAALACGNLYGYAPMGLHAQRLVYLN